MRPLGMGRFFDRLTDLVFGGSGAEPALPNPRGAGFVPADEVGEDFHAPEHEALEHPLANRAFVICYEDSTGRGSERRIICHDVYASGALSYIKARCLERQAPRTFRVDRVREAYCGVTGEELGAPSALFVPYGAERDMPMPSERYQAVQRGVQILMSLARADGQVHPAEEDVVFGFIDFALPSPGDVADRESLKDYAYRQAPSFGTFLRTFDRMLRYNGEIIPHLFDAVGPPLEADGGVHPSEARLVAHMIDRAEGAGLRVRVTDA